MGLCKHCNINYDNTMYVDFKFCPICGTCLIPKGECTRCGDKSRWIEKHGLCFDCKVTMMFDKRKWRKKLQIAIMPK